MKRLLFAMMLLALPALAADARQSLLDADIAFDKATAERGLDGWMSNFAEDARLNARGGEVIGKAALRAFYAKMFARPAFSIRWKPLHAEASQDATLGYTYGVAETSFKDESGAVKRNEGHYVTVWRKSADGSWKVVSDLGN